VKAIGDNLPDFPAAKTPLALIAVLEGFIENIVADLKSLFTLIVTLVRINAEFYGSSLNVLPGVNIQPTAIRNVLRAVADTAQTIARGGVFTAFTAVAIGIQNDQQDSNPFEPISTIRNDGPADDLNDLFAEGLIYSRNSYVSFASGWYIGFILSFFAPAILSGGASALGRSGTLARSARVLLNDVAKVGRIANKLGYSRLTVGNTIPIASALVSGSNTLDESATPGVVTGLAELTFVRNVQVRERYLGISATLPQAVFDQVQQIHPDIDEGEARTLTRYLARTGTNAPSTLDSAAFSVGTGVADTETGRLLAPGSSSRIINARIQRILVEGQASGELSEQDVPRALDRLDAPDDRADRTALINMVATTGTEGVVFLAETSRADTADVAETLVDQRTARGGSGGNPGDPFRGSDSGVGLDGEFRRMVRQAGGENVSVAVSALSTDQLVKLLELEAGSASVARANMVKALADGELAASEIESFVDEVKAASLSDRQRRINDVAYSSNTTQTADAVTAE
jgi:hypothetical protein